MDDEDDYVLLGTKPGGKQSAARTYAKNKRMASKNFQEDFMARRGYAIFIFDINATSLTLFMCFQIRANVDPIEKSYHYWIAYYSWHAQADILLLFLKVSYYDIHLEPQ